MEHNQVTPEWIDEQRQISEIVDMVCEDAPGSEVPLLKQIEKSQTAALDALEASIQREAEKDAVISRLTAERDAAIEAIIPVCCRCRHFYKKSRGVYSCRRSGEMEQVYSWDNNEMPCDDFEWENPCEKNTDAPTGAESEGEHAE